MKSPVHFSTIKRVIQNTPVRAKRKAMPKYKIYGNVEYESPDWDEVEEVIEAKNYDDAMNYARDMAIDEYDSYGGMHGLRDADTILEEGEAETYDEAYEIYLEERESYLNYDAKEIKE